ncbi:hypothetical protein BDV40DRAFT_92708 [Aspergillus tamarii]|uniref:Uncharacterized protein n=1 Tax=Aspergillus tamarii TaxID=41984 RepID=A0A5N6UBW5_ASPTM|nr:hypothetical protein BDV40DRAFT_92708 [Aspergillus tamarii]
MQCVPNTRDNSNSRALTTESMLPSGNPTPAHPQPPRLEEKIPKQSIPVTTGALSLKLQTILPLQAHHHRYPYGQLREGTYAASCKYLAQPQEWQYNGASHTQAVLCQHGDVTRVSSTELSPEDIRAADDAPAIGAGRDSESDNLVSGYR